MRKKWQYCQEIRVRIKAMQIKRDFYLQQLIDGKQLEVDFVVNEGNQRYYIQSALALPDEDKRKQEMESLLRINDSFKKMVIVKDDIKPWRDENGILMMGLLDFLMKPDSLGR